MSNRLTQLSDQLKEASLDAILITYLPHIRYLTGFSGSAGVLLVTSAGRAVFITDFRYQEQIATELSPGVEGVIDRAPYQRLVADGLVAPGMSVGFQETHVTVAALDGLKKAFKRVKLEKTGAMVDDLTMIKTDAEIASIKKAADMAAKVYKEILAIVKPGMRENEVAMEISYLGKKFGSEGDAFGIIVASGARGALPHGRASTKKIKKGEMVTLDFGCIHNGFNSDMTRTFAVGKPNDEARSIYDIVLRSQIKGVAAARAGMTGKELDDVCRDEIAAAGYGAEFGHGTGHGLGIDVHEGPGISFRGEAQVLKPGMVVTIEPGIYIPNRCGVRIEDDVVITETGCRVLTRAPKDLIII
ncbi:MAG: Xaa-Pro peptidase family protein [Candidatus Kapaibacterium sp.]